MLKQAQYKPLDVVHQVILLFAAMAPEGFIDHLPTSALHRYEHELFAYLANQKSEVLKSFETGVFKTDLKKKDDPLRAMLVEALSEFKVLFAA